MNRFTILQILFLKDLKANPIVSPCKKHEGGYLQWSFGGFKFLQDVVRSSECQTQAEIGEEVQMWEREIGVLLDGDVTRDAWDHSLELA